MKKLQLKIIGIHCKSCKELIENEIDTLPGVKNVEVNLKTYEAEIKYDDQKISEYEIIKEIENLNYEARVIASSKKIGKNTLDSPRLPDGQAVKPKNDKFFRNSIILGIALLLIGILYFVISRFGFLELLGKLNEPNLSYPLIFVIGLLASFHCIGMCGGIVMAYTSRYCATVKGNKRISFPHIYYNLGRILSYALTGVILGGIGSFFGINKTFTGIITLLAGLFMIAVGLSLLARLSILDKITGILPASFARLFSNQLHASKPKGPFIVGFINGFIPCGPLQALQVYALASGSALTGGLSMAAFGLGTAPLMLGFGNIISMFSQSRLKQVMKVSGVIVILLGLLTLSRAWGSFSWNNDARSFPGNEASVQPKNSTKNIEPSGNFQTVEMKVTSQGYIPNSLTVKKGVPVKWVIDASGMSGCTSAISMPAFGIDKQLKRGENIIEFTPKVAGTYKFSCGMQMVWGKFIVTE